MISIRPLRKREVSPILRLSDMIFGSGYMKIRDIDERFLVVRVDGRFAGFVNTQSWSEEEISDRKHKLGLIETVAVHKDYRGLGLGTMLVSAACAHLIHENVQLIECFATTWRDSGICFIKGALLRNGFVAESEFPGYWKNDPPEYLCPSCNSMPCLCDATLYRRQKNNVYGE
jgi:GNAT superfamily N-acetyltransferase